LRCDVVIQRGSPPRLNSTMQLNVYNAVSVIVENHHQVISLAITAQTDVPDFAIDSIHATLALVCFMSHLQHHLELWCISFGDVSGFSQHLPGSPSVL